MKSYFIKGSRTYEQEFDTIKDYIIWFKDNCRVTFKTVKTFRGNVLER